jgi:glycerate kinase
MPTAWRLATAAVVCGLNSIDLSGLDARLHDCAIRVACDVTNPLTGDTGASRIFGPQKGATEAMIRELDSNLAHYADVIKADLHVDERLPARARQAVWAQR